MNRLVSSRRGMTLPELLVVVAIIGLLAVTVLPVLGGSKQRAQVRDAADALVTHVSEVAAKAMGSSHGASTWYETESSGAGNDQAVVKLGFGRVRAAITASGTLTAAGPGNATLSPALLPALATCLPAPIEFVGSPSLLLATSLNTVTAIFPALNRTMANTAIPLSPNTTGIQYVLHVPPRPRLTASARNLPNNMAIDFAWSSIGVPGFTQPTRIISAAGAATGPRCIAVTYDRTGRPNRAWYALGHPDTGASPPAWSFVTLDAATPIALLVGPRANVANAYVASPNEDNPGANWQNPDARWVLIDPRTSIVRSIETYAKAATRDASLKFVVDALKNQ